MEMLVFQMLVQHGGLDRVEATLAAAFGRLPWIRRSA